MSQIIQRLVRTSVVLAVVAALVPLGSPARATSIGIVIGEVYGGGGNNGAPYRNDFIELFNLSDKQVDVSGWSVQYTSAAGDRWQLTPISGVIGAGERYLVKEGSGGSSGQELPPPDAAGSIGMSSTSGKVALVSTATRLSCGSSCSGEAAVVDLVGYGSSANDHEGAAPSPTLSNTRSASRIGGGCIDTDQNGEDFETAPPSPWNSSAPAQPCSGHADLAIAVAESRDPVAIGTSFRYRLTITNFGPADATEVAVTDSLPVGMVLETATSDGSCSEMGGTVTCELAALGVNRTTAVLLVVSVTMARAGTNTAQVSAAQVDETPASASDTTTITGPDCSIIGTTGDDVLIGTVDPDVICGLGGVDTLSGKQGNDLVVGGIGNDRQTGGPGDDELVGWSGGDGLTGDSGADSLDGGEQGDVLESRDGVGGNDTLDGGPHTDKCHLDPGDASTRCP